MAVVKKDGVLKFVKGNIVLKKKGNNISFYIS